MSGPGNTNAEDADAEKAYEAMRAQIGGEPVAGEWFEAQTGGESRFRCSVLAQGNACAP